MKRVIPFSNARYFFFAFSILLVLAGAVGYYVNGGFNLGVDFKAGIALQFQVAPSSFSVQYDGTDAAEISIPAGEQRLTSAGNIIITVKAADGTSTDYPFVYSQYATVRDLTAAIAGLPGLTVTAQGNMDAVPTDLLPLTRPQDITGKAAVINLAPGPGRGVTTDISDMRTVLAPLGQVALQAVGTAASQEFIARLEAKTGEADFQTRTEAALMQVLEAKYGAGQVILKSTNFIGQRVAQSLGTQAILLIFVAILLIMVYMMFRFRPYVFAVAAVIAIVHDAIIMLSFDAIFRVEIDAATIAAILTILGYSINDTIVIFDRVRENKGLMRGTDLRGILDTSVTQTLSRTFITSGATLLTVIALYALTSGSLKNFSLNMIVGIVEGTYSTFIASFIVLEWTNASERRRKRRELEKFGISGAAKPVTAEAAAEEEGGPVVEPDAVPGAVSTAGTEVPGGDDSAVQAAGAPAAPPAEVALAAEAGQAAAAAKPVPQRGSDGARRNKKRRRHF